MAKDILEFYKPVTPGRRKILKCLDDRAPMVGDMLADEEGVCTAAGILGLAQDTAAALTIHDNDSAWNVPIGIFTKHTARVMRRNGLEVCTHSECAAELGAAGIAGLIVDLSADARERAGLILGRDLSSKEVDGSRRYYEHLLSNTEHYRGADAEAACMDSDAEYPAISRVGLAFKDHKAGTLIVNRRQGTIFRTQDAYQAGQPYYNLDEWYAKRCARELSHEHPVNPESIMAGMAIRHAVTAGVLPNPAGGQGIEIRILAA